MKSYLSAVVATFGISALTLFSACQDEDFGYNTEEIRASVYDRNFIDYYGAIDPEETWDFSPYGQYLRVMKAAEKAATRATTITKADVIRDTRDPVMDCETRGFDHYLDDKMTTGDNWYRVDNDGFKTWLDLHLPEDHYNYGDYNQAFSMIAPYNSFEIIPVYQGIHNQDWDLHMVITTPSGVKYDQPFWHESQNIQVSTNGTTWNNLETCAWDNASTKSYDNDSKTYDYVRTKGITFNGIEPGSVIELYLHNTCGQVTSYTGYYTSYDGHSHTIPNSNNNAPHDSRMWSSNGKMVYITDYPRPSFVSEDKQVMLIGVEDCFLKGTTYEYLGETRYPDGDDDMNDLVFLVVAKTLPAVVDVNNIKKRYMVEDLGSVVDWDFNDVVIDVEQTTNSSGTVTQKATMMHRCGTTPFDISIGSVKLNGSAYTLGGVNYNANDHIPGIVESDDQIVFNLPAGTWDPETNNITVTVYTSKSMTSDTNDGIYTGNSNPPTGENVSFPLAGAVPRIISVDTNKAWTAESQNVDLTYFYDYNSSSHVQYTLTVEANNSAYGSVSGSGSFFNGYEADIKAIANANCTFVKWSDGDTNPVRSYKVTKTETLTAVFSGPTTYTITASIASDSEGRGTVNGPLSVLENGTATLIATPASGYAFEKWTSDEAGNTTLSTSATYNVTNVTADATYYAHFVEYVAPVITILKTTNQTFNSGWGNIDITLDNYTPEQGDQLVFSISNVGNGYGLELVFSDNGWNNNDLHLKTPSEKTETSIVYTVDQKLLNLLNNYNKKFKINAGNLTLNSIGVIKYSGSPSSGGGNSVELLNNSVTVEWNSTSVTPPNNIDLTDKTKIIISGSISSDYVRLGTTDQATEEFLTIAAENITWNSNRFKNGKFETNLTDDLKTKLSNTFYIKGNGTISSIVVE